MPSPRGPLLNLGLAQKSHHELIDAIPEEAGKPIPYWLDGAADVAEVSPADGEARLRRLVTDMERSYPSAATYLEQVIEHLATAGADEPLTDRVRPRRPEGQLHDFDAF